MISVIDIGNTTIHCALFSGGEPVDSEKFQSPMEVSDFTAGAEKTLIISVSPEREKIIRKTLKTDPISFPEHIIELDYRSKPGADRLANGLGASLSLGLPCIVIDCGSAITVDEFSKSEDASKKLRFNGGGILPGLEWYFSSLSPAECLPEVRPGLSEKPGKTTKECIEFGAYGCFIGGLKEILNIMNRKDGKIIFTGGSGKMFAEKFNAPYDPLLTLRGGYIAFEYIS